jgi:hypothetical protein
MLAVEIGKGGPTKADTKQQGGMSVTGKLRSSSWKPDLRHAKSSKSSSTARAIRSSVSTIRLRHSVFCHGMALPTLSSSAWISPGWTASIC